MEELKNLPASAALDIALGQSGLTREEVGHRMGWRASHTNRIFNSSESYFPSLESLPKFCAELGNNVIPDWLYVNTAELRKGRHDNAPRLNEFEVLQLINSICKEVGDINKVVESALNNNGKIDGNEPKAIIREAHDVLARSYELVSAMHAIQGEKL